MGSGGVVVHRKWHRLDTRDVDTWRIPPQTLQIVVTPLILLEDMENDIPIIHQDPLPLFDTFDQRTVKVISLRCCVTGRNDGLNMGLRRGGDYQKVVSIRNQVGDFEKDRRKGLLVDRGLGQEKSLLQRFD